ncbi:hypothetical protein ACLM5J_05165 [Nocardioides sp. Bht2]|uniref:hypothetical protein n=1 Tax=Nocardioides sp. Bht2 TaxID=3392297 RepID=UPI0039B5A97B
MTSRSMRPWVALLPGLLLGAVLGACSTDAGDDATGSPNASSAPTAVDSQAIPDDVTIEPGTPATDPRQALALIPADAGEVTLTDFRQLRERLGYPRLTSESLMTDRNAFWERVRTETPALTQGLLRDQASRLWLDYGFGQDDVAWEARFDTPDGAGYVVSFRRGQEMAAVRRAVADRATGLRGATVMAKERLLVRHIAGEGDAVLASVPGLADLLDKDAEASYLRTDCVPFAEALGDDATVEDQESLLSKVDIRYLRPLTAWAVNFDSQVLTARLTPESDEQPERADLHQRADLMEVWPETGPIDWPDGFRGLTVADPMTGRIGAQVRNPVAAANLVLAGRVPFAVCNEATPMAEPTGL